MENQNGIIDNQAELKNEIQQTTSTVIEVVDQVTYERANDQIGKLQTMKKGVEARFSDPKKKAQEAHKAICALEKEFLAPIESAMTVLKNGTTAWYAAEQKRIAAEEERRREDAEGLVELAVEAESNGDTETAAEAVMAAAVESAGVSYVPKCAGTAMREVWRAEVVDKNLVPREYLVVNQTVLDALAKATKGEMEIPGVKFVKSYSNSTRAK